MNLVSENELKQYYDSGLYQLLRSYQNNSSDFQRFVLTHYLPNKNKTAEEQEAVKKLQTKQASVNQNTQPTTPTAPPISQPTVQNAPTKTTSQIGNIQEPATEIAKPRPQASQQPTIPARRKEQATNATTSFNQNPKNISATQSKPKTKSFTETIPPLKPNNASTTSTVSVGQSDSIMKYESVVKDEEKASQGEKKNMFLDLQKAFETTEWINAANKVALELNNQVQQMPIKNIKCKDLRLIPSDKAVGYIPFDTRSLNIIHSIIIQKELSIILIFNDGTTLNIAPEKWLSQGATVSELLQHKYNYVYYDLDLPAFIKGLKPLCASEVNAPSYLQMWLKYVPFVPLND